MNRTLPIALLALLTSGIAGAQVYYSSDDAAGVDNWLLDVASGISSGPTFTGVAPWGVADDDAGQVLYINNGSNLYTSAYGVGGPVTLVGQMTYLGASRNYTALAHHNGKVYGSPNISVEGIYEVDVVSLVSTLVHMYPNTAIDIGGLDVDPATGLLLGSNDSSTYTDTAGTAGRGIVVFDLGAMTETTTFPYPAGETDVDAMALDPAGVVWYLEDEPAPLHNYDIATMTFDPAPPMNAILGAELFSGGTYTTGGGGGGVGTPYCTATPNSTGVAGVLSGSGSAVVANNDLVLHATQLPQNATVLFLTSLTQGLIQPVGSSGNLCLGGGIGRYVGPGQIMNSGASGSATLAVNLNQHPTPGGLVQVNAGETWNFQAWHRDLTGGGALTSNFTQGLEVTFN